MHGGYPSASRIPPGLFVWLLGRSVVWSFGVFRLGRDADAQKTAVDFSIQLRCRADLPPRFERMNIQMVSFSCNLDVDSDVNRKN